MHRQKVRKSLIRRKNSLQQMNRNRRNSRKRMESEKMALCMIQCLAG